MESAELSIHQQMETGKECYCMYMDIAMEKNEIIKFQENGCGSWKGALGRGESYLRIGEEPWNTSDMTAEGGTLKGKKGTGKGWGGKWELEDDSLETG